MKKHRKTHGNASMTNEKFKRTFNSSKQDDE